MHREQRSIAGLALVEELDKRLLVQLRDGRKIVGVLRCLMIAQLSPHEDPDCRSPA